MAILDLSKNMAPMPPSVHQQQDRRRFLASLFALALLGPGSSRALLAQESPGYQIKAVFLFNFAQFVTWPESAFADRRAPFVIGILGQDPFGRSLDETVRNEVVGGRKLEVRRFRSVDEVKGCQILFISSSEEARLFEILDALDGRPVLTVGETERFAKDGGMIRFLSERNKIRFRINLEEAERAGLTISSKLLRLAEIVQTERSRR